MAVINFRDASNNAFTTAAEVSGNGSFTPHHVIEVAGNPISNTNPAPVLLTNTQVILLANSSLLSNTVTVPVNVIGNVSVTQANNSFALLANSTTPFSNTLTLPVNIVGNVTSTVFEVTYTPTATNTITTGGTSQLLFANSATTHGFRVQNPSTATESLFINDAGLAANTTGAGCIEIPIGSLYESPFCPNANVNITANTTGHVFYASAY